jgi:arginyl-tRNA synthetase
MNKSIQELEKSLQDSLESYDVNIKFTANFSSFKNVDIQINQLIQLKNHENFNEISKTISEKLRQAEIIENHEITEQGFINIILNDRYFETALSNDAEQILNSLKFKTGSVIIDYGGANIGKSLHVGHLRTLTIGRALENIYKLSGYKVVSDIHFGDWGMPIGLILAYIDNEKLNINNITSEDLEIIYPEAALLAKNNEDFKSKAYDYTKKLNIQDSEAIRKWKIIYDISTENLISFLEKMNFKFDLYKGESDVVTLIPDMMNNLKEKNLVKEDQGAIVANDNQDPPAILVKSDGSYIYMTTDLATIIDRESKLNPDRYVYVVDQRQHQHFEQLFKLIKLFSLSNAKFEHVGFGTINGKDGKPLKTRDGGNYKLSQLYQDIENQLKNKNSNENLTSLTKAVLTYSDLSNSRLKNYSFDVEKFTNINGKSAVYIQYAQVRAKKLLQQYKGNLAFSHSNQNNRKLLFELIKFEYFFKLSLQNNEPHHLAEYLYKMCQEFNSFYNAEKIFSDNKTPEEISNDLFVVSCFIQNLTIISECLGIELVNEM